MSERPIDFTPLDPREDSERFDRLVRGIGDSAQLELSSRRARNSVFGQLAGWRRPLLAAAAIIAIVSGVTLSQMEGPTSASDDEVGVAEVIGVPEAIAGWVRSGETPSTAEVLVALEAAE